MIGIFPGSTRGYGQNVIYTAAVFLLAASFFAPPAEAQRRRGGDEPPAITFVDVSMRPRNDRVAAVGSSRARQEVTLTARVAGVVSDVFFEGGSKVSADEPLLKLLSEPEAIAVETAEAQRAQAFDTVERYNQLSSGSITRVAKSEAETALKVADAALRAARYQLDQMTIRAPFAGVMGLTNLQPGDYVAVGDAIATIDDRSTLIIEFTVPEAVASSVKIGLPVRANPIARTGDVSNGKVQAVGTRIDPVSRTLRVRAEIPNTDLSLIPGSTFSVSIRLPGEEAPELPGLAIQWDRAGAFVWRLTGENTVERVDAVILARNGDRVLVEADLEAGDKVVHEGGGFLRAGQTVNPQNS